MQVANLTILPALEATTGIPTGISTDFTKPFISQLKINGTPAVHVFVAYFYSVVIYTCLIIPLTSLRPLSIPCKFPMAKLYRDIDEVHTMLMRLHGTAGGGPLPGISSANLIPSFTSMSFKPKKVRLALCHGEPFHSSRPPALSTELCAFL